MIVQQFVHNGLIFYYTDEVIASGESMIGFYFDHLGYPQKIHRDSIYGGYILNVACGEEPVERDSKNAKHKSPTKLPSNAAMTEIVCACKRMGDDKKWVRCRDIIQDKQLYKR